MGRHGRVFPTRWREDRPPSLEKFTEDFNDDYACADYLAKRRWSSGYKCPQCSSNEAWRLESRPWLWECKGVVVDKNGRRHRTGCRHQTSVIAGTVMHGPHLPLRKWFLAAYLMATHSNGISALQFQSKLGLGSYKTAWLLLHKLRRATVDPDRTKLSGTVEIDETFMSYRKKMDPVGKGGGRSLVGQMAIIGGVEIVDTYYSGRIRLERIPNTERETLQNFVWDNTERGATIKTDGYAGYANPIHREHIAINLSGKNAPPAHIALPWIHRVFSNFKRWAMGTYHGLRDKHVDSYCNEFVFRWNRRRAFQRSIDTMLRIGSEVGPAPYREIVGDIWKWKKQHEKMILRMLAPEVLIKARNLAHKTGSDIFDAIDDVKRFRATPMNGGLHHVRSCHPGDQARNATPGAISFHRRSHRRSSAIRR
jgi:hypothetical protein